MIPIGVREQWFEVMTPSSPSASWARGRGFGVGDSTSLPRAALVAPLPSTLTAPDVDSAEGVRVCWDERRGACLRFKVVLSSRVL